MSKSFQLSLLVLIFISVSGWGAETASSRATKPLNLLILTVDDMSCDSMGAFGCKLADTTPNMDKLAEGGLRFRYAHVQVGNCMPSRNVMWSGRYPHNNGVEGFYQVPDARHPMLCDLAKEAGYFTAIRHKIGHSSPFSPYTWDLELDVVDGVKIHQKDASSYGDSVSLGIKSADQAGKPFFLCINVSDPHKPFYSQVKNGKDPHVPTLVYDADQVPVPGFLPDDPVIRKELALYYSTVRRADDAVGAVMKALEASGRQDETIVLFLSDHGMPLPFAKTQLYHHSTRTPLVVHVPGITKPGAIDETHMVSAVDFVPTLTELLGWRIPGELDGRSFASIIKGQTQTGRDFVIKEYNENSGAKRNPMRAIETKDYLYIFNPWSNGSRPMATATNGTQSYRRMKQLAAENREIAARVELMDHREVEELYHVGNDPDCLVNLIDAADYATVAKELRSKLLKHMQQTNDPIAELLPKREDASALESYMQLVQQEATERRAKRKNNQQKAATKTTNRTPGKNLKWITFSSVEAGNSTLQVTISHKIPKNAGKKKLTVTLKGPDKKRVSRQEKEISGAGNVQIVFQSVGLDINACSVAAFVGPSYEMSIQHIQETVAQIKQQ